MNRLLFILLLILLGLSLIVLGPGCKMKESLENMQRYKTSEKNVDKVKEDMKKISEKIAAEKAAAAAAEDEDEDEDEDEK